jgi:diacylglycerol kinase (ATP)
MIEHNSQSDESQKAFKEEKIPEKATGIHRVLRAFLFSRDGFLYMLKEAAFRQEFLLTLVLGAALFFLDISLKMKMFMLASLILVMIVEILNTGMEIIIDMISPGFDLRAKAVKDAGSLAVLMSFIIVAIVWFTGLYIG